MRARLVFEKFQAESDPIHDLGIGLFDVQKMPGNKFYFIERGPRFVEGGKPTTYIYTLDKGNVYRKHPDLYMGQGRQELRSNSFAFHKGNPNKMAIPNDFDKAYAFIMDHYMKKRKRAKMHEAFTPDSDPIKDLNIGVLNKLEPLKYVPMEHSSSKYENAVIINFFGKKADNLFVLGEDIPRN